MPARRIEVAIVGDASSLERAFGKASKSTKKFGVSLGTLSKAGAVGAAAGGAALLTKGLTSSIKAAMEAEAAQTRLAGAFQSAGVGQKQYAAAQAKISAVSKRAALDDEDLSDSLAKLTRTSGSAAKGMRGMELAANIARARNISLESATRIVEKAMTGQFRGLKAVGVEIGKNTSTTEALERAQKKFAGSAEAYGKTAAGAQDKLSVAFENLQERVGAKLLPVLTKLSLKLVDLIDWSEKNWPKFKKAAEPVFRVVEGAIKRLTVVFKDWLEGFKGVIKIVQGIANGEWGKVWSGMKQVAVNQIKLLYHALLALPMKIVGALGKKAWSGLKAVGGYIGDAIKSGLKAALQKALDIVQAFINRLKPVAGALGKIGIDVKVPKVNDALRDKSPARRGTPGASIPRDSGMQTRRTSATGGGGVTINGGLTLHGIQNPAQFLREMQRMANTQATPRRGRYGGANLGVG